MRILAKHTALVLLTSFLFICTQAQLCTGSLGDPVVNITFGTGSNPGPALPGSITNYIYVSNACPQDGFYAITNSVPGCFTNTWHVLTEDHTPGDLDGYMMVVNGSFSPGVFYLDTVKSLCSGTTYEFSAWMLSILKSSACQGSGISPNISFSIETTSGTVVQAYNTGNIPNLSSPTWKQYGFYFTLPPGVSDLVLRMSNNAPGGCGNDIVLDDITFRPCGPKVNINFSNIAVTGDTAHYCITDNKNISFNGSIQSGFINPVFQWQASMDSGQTWQDIAGETNAIYSNTFSASGRFEYRISAAESGNIGIARCRVASAPLIVLIDAIPVSQTTANSPVCVNAVVNLNATNGNAYAWTGPNGFAATGASPVISKALAANAGKYYVQVTSTGGCVQRDSVTLVVNALPVADAGADVALCESGSTHLQASGGLQYSWTPTSGLSDAGIANPVATPANTTEYYVSVTNAFSCNATDSVRVTVLTKPVANAGPDKKIVNGQTIVLDGSITGDTSSYFWTPNQSISNTAVLKPVVNPSADITYTLHAMSANGCGTSSDDVFVRVFQKLSIPNAFSPNGDGIHDVWNIEALDSYPDAETRVFNRYGQVIFQCRAYPQPWNGTINGKPVPSGTYYYTIDRKNDFPLISGWVLIVR